MWLSWGKKTNMRPAKLICVDRRAPLLPIGSLITCTIRVWPSNTCFSMGRGAWPLGVSLSACRAVMVLSKSPTCKKAARSKPTSMNADCMPGKTRETLPR